MAHPPKHLDDPPALRKAFDRVRAISMALDGVYEKEAWGEPTFRVEKGKMFLMFADDHHGDGRVGFWCMSTEDAREALLAIDAERFYVPPYMGPSGWVGVQITAKPPWDIIEEVIREGHRLASPKPKARPTRGPRSAGSTASKSAPRSTNTPRSDPAKRPTKSLSKSPAESPTKSLSKSPAKRR